MDITTIICLVALGLMVIGGIATIVVAIIRGDMKRFIEDKMVEAEQLELTGDKKLAYVLQAVKEKYKIAETLLNCKKFIEHIIALSKQINAK